MLSDDLIYSLKDLLGQISLAHRFYIKETGLESSTLEFIVESLFVLCNENLDEKVLEKIKKLKEVNGNLAREKELSYYDLTKDKIFMTYLYIAKNNCDKIIKNMKDNFLLKELLDEISLFIINFIKFFTM